MSQAQRTDAEYLQRSMHVGSETNAEYSWEKDGMGDRWDGRQMGWEKDGMGERWDGSELEQ